MDTKRTEKLREMRMILDLLEDENLVEFEVHCKENAMYLHSLGYKVAKVSETNWWVEVRPL